MEHKKLVDKLMELFDAGVFLPTDKMAKAFLRNHGHSIRPQEGRQALREKLQSFLNRCKLEGLQVIFNNPSYRAMADLGSISDAIKNFR